MMWLSVKNHRSLWFYAILSFLVILVFRNSLFFEFVWDDSLLLVGNKVYQSINLKLLLFEPINGLEYLPLRDLTYIADHFLWGWNPMGFHLSNLILYVLNVLVVYRLTFVLGTTVLVSGYDNKKDNAVWVAMFTAMLFAVLPLHSEVVSYIHCRNVLLSGLFFFLSIIYFLKFIESRLQRYYVLSLLLFTCALLSKATVIIFPLILLTLLYLRPQPNVKDYKRIIPFFLLAIVFFLIFKFQATESGMSHEDFVMVFGNNIFHHKMAVALQIPYFYMDKLLAPLNLSTEYGVGFSEDLYSIKNIFAFSVLGSFLSIAYWFKNKFPQGLFALVWFLICLIPVSNIFMTNPVVADRYVYLASYAYAFILAICLFQIGKKTNFSVALILFVLILGGYSWLTVERNNVWRTQVTVMEDMIKPYSNQTKGFTALGHYYFDRKQFSKAFENFQRAKEISPAFSELEYHQARLAFMENKPREALENLERALRGHINVKEAFVWNLRGEVHESQEELLLAVRSYQKSLASIYSTKATREYALIRLQHVKAKLGPSLEFARKDMLAHPEDLDRKLQLAVKLQSAGFRQEAIALYEDLLRLGGERWQVHYNLGLLYRDEKQIEKSLHHYQISLSLNETSAMIHNELGVLYKMTGHFNEAVSHFLHAYQLDPQSVKPQVNLAMLYFQLGEAEPAREMFKHILLNFPEYQSLARNYLLKIPY